MGNITVVLSYKGNGMFAVQPDSIAKDLRISVIVRGEKHDFTFYSKIFLGNYGKNVYQGLIMDSIPIAVYTAEFKKGDSVGILMDGKYKGFKFPRKVKITEPSSDMLEDWGSISLKWEGDAGGYILRVYAFTLMDQRDFLRFVRDNRFNLDLSDMYGNGFLALHICPVNGNNEKFRRIFVLGECDESVIIVGDPSVWEGEKPEPPWKSDEVMWYLLTF